MALRVVRPAPALPAPVVVIYHLGSAADAAVLQAWPEAAIVNQTYPGFKDHYTHLGPDAIAPIEDVLQALGMAESDVAELVLVGFSEGCQGVRTQLYAGIVPAGALAVDGIHTKPEVWRSLAERARAREVALTITHSSIQPGTYASTTQMAAQILAPDVEEPVTTASTDLYPQISQYEDGLFRVAGYAGADAGAHIYQGREVLPQELARMRETLGSGSLRRSFWTRTRIAIAAGLTATLALVGGIVAGRRSAP